MAETLDLDKGQVQLEKEMFSFFLLNWCMTGGVHVPLGLPQLSLEFQTCFEKRTHFFVVKSNTKVK